MSRTNRLTGIMLALRGGRHSVQNLADRFDVSRRTILRDLAALSEIGVPIVTISGTGGGVEIAEGYWLPPLHLTAGEAATLLLGLQALGAAHAPLAVERRTAEEKVQAVLDADLAGRVASELDRMAVAPPTTAASEEIFSILQDAIRRGVWVTGVYQSERRVAPRILRPIRLLLDAGRWYCLARSADAGVERRYRIDRFDDLRPCGAPPAGPVSDGGPNDGRPRPYDDPGYLELEIRFTYIGMRRAEDEPGWRDHLTACSDGTWEVRFRCPPGEHAFYARLVCALGTEAEAISPPAFRAMVQAMVRATMHHYGETT